MLGEIGSSDSLYYIINEEPTISWLFLSLVPYLDIMATATLTFNLDDPEDQVAHLRCIKATKIAVALWDMDQYLRSKTKYAPDSMPGEVYDALQEARDELYSIMQIHSVDLDELLK